MKKTLTDQEVAEIRHLLNVAKRTPTEIARQYGVRRQLISDIAWGKSRPKNKSLFRNHIFFVR